LTEEPRQFCSVCGKESVKGAEATLTDNSKAFVCTECVEVWLLMHPELAPRDELTNGKITHVTYGNDWMEQLKEYIGIQVHKHNALGFYLVIVDSPGHGVSLGMNNPVIDRQKFLAHVASCIHEDYNMEALR
jgi:hypothetical protein